MLNQYDDSSCYLKLHHLLLKIVTCMHPIKMVLTRSTWWLIFITKNSIICYLATYIVTDIVTYSCMETVLTRSLWWLIIVTKNSNMYASNQNVREGMRATNQIVRECVHPIKCVHLNLTKYIKVRISYFSHFFIQQI